MIERIYVSNYRGFDGFEWHPGGVNLLTGGNGSGKSTLLDLLFGLTGIVAWAVEPVVLFRLDSISHGSQSPTQRVELDVASRLGLFRYSLEMEHDRDHVLVAEERLSLDDRVLMELRHGRLSKRAGEEQYFTGLSAVSDQEDSEIQHFCHLLKRFVLTSPCSYFPMVVGAQTRLSPDLKRFPTWFNVNSPEHSVLSRSVGEAFGVSLEDFLSSTEPLDPKSFAWLSSGERALWAQRLIPCLLGPSSTLLLDEPEQSMALAEIEPWLMGCLKQIEQTGSQLFLASHHPRVIDVLGRHSHHWWLNRSAQGGGRRIHLQDEI